MYSHLYAIEGGEGLSLDLVIKDIILETIHKNKLIVKNEKFKLSHIVLNHKFASKAIIYTAKTYATPLSKYPYLS